MKVLLVEDNSQLNKALTTLLKRNSYIVDSALDGEEALLNYIKEQTGEEPTEKEVSELIIEIMNVIREEDEKIKKSLSSDES